MKKMYIEPSMMAVEVIATQMMAQSLIIDGETTVRGKDALTKEDDYWDIWEE